MRLIKAFFYSLNGLKEAYLSEVAFRLEVYAFPLVIALCAYFPLSSLERGILFLSYGIVLITELLNTALEKTIDRISLDHHDLSKKVKDIASAAVFVAVVLCVCIWLSILTPKYLW